MENTYTYTHTHTHSIWMADCSHTCTHTHAHTHARTHKRTQKLLQKRSGHIFGQRRQCNYNLAHEISLLVFPFPTTNHMDKGRLGKKITLFSLCWVIPALNTILFIIRWKYCNEKMKTLAPHWFCTSDWLLSVCVLVRHTRYYSHMCDAYCWSP